MPNHYILNYYMSAYNIFIWIRCLVRARLWILVFAYITRYTSRKQYFLEAADDSEPFTCRPGTHVHESAQSISAHVGIQPSN